MKLLSNLALICALTASFNAFACEDEQASNTTGTKVACDCDKKGGHKCEKGKECGCDKKDGKSCEDHKNKS